MSTSAHESTSNTPRRRGPRNRIAAESPKDDSAALRELREHTAGLSNRLGLPSLEAMRAGTAWSPQGMIRRYFLAAYRRGLPKSWALRLVEWAHRQADLIWRDRHDQTPLGVLEERAMVKESADDLAELAYHNSRCPERLIARRDALAKEIAADQELLQKYDVEIERCQQ